MAFRVPDHVALSKFTRVNFTLKTNCVYNYVSSDCYFYGYISKWLFTSMPLRSVEGFFICFYFQAQQLHHRDCNMTHLLLIVMYLVYLAGLGAANTIPQAQDEESHEMAGDPFTAYDCTTRQTSFQASRYCIQPVLQMSAVLRIGGWHIF